MNQTLSITAAGRAMADNGPSVADEAMGKRDLCPVTADGLAVLLHRSAN